MPSNVLSALIILILIYGVALLNVFAFNRETGIWTAGVGLVILVFSFASHACLTTGGCPLVAWAYVLIYLAILLAMVFFTILIFIDEHGDTAKNWFKNKVNTDVANPKSNQDENIESEMTTQSERGESSTNFNENISLDSTGNAEEFIDRRQAQIKRMLKQMRSRD